MTCRPSAMRRSKWSLLQRTLLSTTTFPFQHRVAAWPGFNLNSDCHEVGLPFQNVGIKQCRIMWHGHDHIMGHTGPHIYISYRINHTAYQYHASTSFLSNNIFGPVFGTQYRQSMLVYLWGAGPVCAQRQWGAGCGHFDRWERSPSGH